MDLSSELMAFRTAYLKCIAKSWSNHEYKEQFVSSKGTCKNLLDNKQFKKYLPTNTSLNWKMNISIVNNDNVYYNPFDAPGSDSGWNGSADVIIIKIPQNPYEESRNEDKEAEALADYYNHFTTIFGNSESIKDTEEKMAKVARIQELFEKFEYKPSNLVNAVRKNFNNNMGHGGPNSFLSFGLVVMSLIANCWENPEYFEFITKLNLEPLGEEGSSIRDMYVDFSNPWGFLIKFEKDKKSSWSKSKNCWETLSNNEMYLQYPEKPEDGIMKASALARYNNTGPAFPLTCV